VSRLTPPGIGAIATVAVRGPRAWEFARTLFRPAGKPLPTSPELLRFWFGTLGEGAGDEVILARTGHDSVEIHCHGGRRVVRWVIEQFLARGCVESETDDRPTPARLLPFAPTLRTASILLDQLHGAFDSAVRAILDTGDRETLAELARYAPVGRHLLTPWKVVIAGPPNVGKSSLVNALAGYQRTVVSDVAGTTRDVVTVPLALDGWPVEVADTAGLRGAEGLELQGIERAKRVLAVADLVVWLRDATAPAAETAPEDVPGLVVWNKVDRATRTLPGLGVSARTGAGIPELVAEMVRRLVPHPPPPGAAVPYTPELAAHIEAAASDPLDPLVHLRDCLGPR
jgi:tRNA modification GTPase